MPSLNRINISNTRYARGSTTVDKRYEFHQENNIKRKSVINRITVSNINGNPKRDDFNYIAEDSNTFDSREDKKYPGKKDASNTDKVSNIDISSKRMNSYKGNLSDWLRDAMITKVFNDVANSLKEGKEINLKEIGIKRTPYTKLINKERAEKAIVKRRDFIDILKREENIGIS